MSALQILRCNICGAGPFVNTAEMGVHQNSYHARYICGYCLREGADIPPKFSGWARLRQHMRVQHGDKRDHVTSQERDSWTLANAMQGNYAVHFMNQPRANRPTRDDVRRAVRAGVKAAMRRLFGPADQSTSSEESENDDSFKRASVDYAEVARKRQRLYPRITFQTVEKGKHCTKSQMRIICVTVYFVFVMYQV